jgi:hydrogen peroxide-dependent heme synthase
MTEAPGPIVPETLEGFSVLHQLFRIRWDIWHTLPTAERASAVQEAVEVLSGIGRGADGETAVAALLGHKGDLMFVHLRRSFDELARVQLAVNQLKLARYLELTTSFLSIVELGMYEMTAVIHARLRERGLAPGGEGFETALAAEMEAQRQRVQGRLYCEIPDERYICFYPMSKRRADGRNWYLLPFDERQRMMRDHGKVARRYASQVTQIISGAVGFDDWEWGVDLFAADPLVFKKLIYELRFDEASAGYADFGPFYVGLRFDPSGLPLLLEGQLPGQTSRETSLRA